MADGAVAYLDLLGSKDAVKRGPQFGVQLLEDYYGVIKMAVDDQRLPMGMGCDSDRHQLRQRHLITSFQHFLPLSDSIFVVSTDPPLFVLQLSSFLRTCFDYRMHAFAYPQDSDDPTRVTETVIRHGKNGKLTALPERTSWLPVLFRGGVAYGDVHLLKNACVVNGEYREVHNIVGLGVVEAVALEKRIEESQVAKGPRLLCTKEFAAQLSDDAKRYVGACIEAKSHKDIGEIYWPITYFEDEPNVMAAIQNGLVAPLQATFNLWKEYHREDSEAALQYSGFTRLLVQSARKIYPDNTAEILSAIKKLAGDTCLLESLFGC